MPSKSVTEQRDETSDQVDWKPVPETAPSQLRQQKPELLRVLGAIGLFFTVLACAIFVLVQAGRVGFFGPGWAIFFLATGLIFHLIHAATDGDRQIRRMYGLIGGVLLLLGTAASLLVVNGEIGAYYPYGFGGLALGLLFLTASLRHETDLDRPRRAVHAIGAVGVIAALVAVVGGNLKTELVLRCWLPLGLIGLAYLWAFVRLRDFGNYWGQKVAIGVAFLGMAILATVLVRSLLSGSGYVVPTGVLFFFWGLLYLAVGYGLASDKPLVVQMRRELSSYFHSPVFYLVLFGFGLVACVQYVIFFSVLLQDRSGISQPIPEPIVVNYAFGFIPIIFVIFAFPILTMRLLSEEHRSGTFEVLMTAPITETTVVLSKFAAVLVFFALLWLPWLLPLFILACVGGSFDYVPLMSFFVAMLCFSAACLSMGLFFSSLTRNQIISAVLTTAGMLFLTGVSLVRYGLRDPLPEPWWSILYHVSYLNLWEESLTGMVVPRQLFFQLSMTVFWLFLTIKVLESRKWK